MEDHRAPRAAQSDGGSRHVVPAPAGAGGDRLDRVLAGALPTLSRSRLKALIEAGHVGLAAGDGHGARTVDEPSFRVKPGQIFAVFVPDSAPAKPVGQPIPLAIVHEDEDLVVLDKSPLDESLADEDLSEIKVLATIIGGKVVYGSVN